MKSNGNVAVQAYYSVRKRSLVLKLRKRGQDNTQRVELPIYHMTVQTPDKKTPLLNLGTNKISRTVVVGQTIVVETSQDGKAGRHYLWITREGNKYGVVPHNGTKVTF